MRGSGNLCEPAAAAVTAGKLYANVRGTKGVFATVTSSGQKPDTYAVSLVRGRLPKGWYLTKADVQVGCVVVTGASLGKKRP
ncbi:hypothetical protein [Hydrogenophaga sp. 5NK40-0174]|uniref:hypothetical protein n=1 Tax=Hydrogenophaga sp. 5NK40-0174 TaxID=3127649 RepID=UPI003104E354